MDLTGQRFGRLTVTKRAEDYISPKGNKLPRWECLCDCGNVVVVNAGSLKRKNNPTRSCGCARKWRVLYDLDGMKFGKLQVISRAFIHKEYGWMWLCKCECGKETYASTTQLHMGTKQSCGCLKSELTAQRNYKHGGDQRGETSRLYKVWSGMRQRCNDPDHKSYEIYGGRGIRVCEEWNDFSAFESWAILNGYNESAPFGKCTLDRINVNGNYEPDNCRWVDMKTQSQNKRKK